MGIIVCQCCNKIIEHFDAEKSMVLYGVCKEKECEQDEIDLD